MHKIIQGLSEKLPIYYVFIIIIIIIIIIQGLVLYLVSGNMWFSKNKIQIDLHKT